jgi:hypothetical protein
VRQAGAPFAHEVVLASINDLVRLAAQLDTTVMRATPRSLRLVEMHRMLLPFNGYRGLVGDSRYWNEADLIGQLTRQLELVHVLPVLDEALKCSPAKRAELNDLRMDEPDAFLDFINWLIEFERGLGRARRSRSRRAVALRLGCVSPYKGPPLHGPDGRPLRVTGQTKLSVVQLGSWSSVVGPLAVIEGLEWDFLFGLRDISRCTHLHVDFSVTPPAVQLGGAPASVSESVSPSAVVGSVSSSDTLSAVSAIGAATDADLRAADEHARVHAMPIPPSMGASAASSAEPAIVYSSSEGDGVSQRVPRSQRKGLPGGRD